MDNNRALSFGGGLTQRHGKVLCTEMRRFGAVVFERMIWLQRGGRLRTPFVIRWVAPGGLLTAPARYPACAIAETLPQISS